MVAVYDFLFSLPVILLSIGQCFAENTEGSLTSTFRIEGKVDVLSARDKEWMSNTRILVDGGEYLGFLRSDGSFSVNVPSGSYLIEISNPTYVFEPSRVDITSKGKIRARRVNNVQPSSVKNMPYPLEFRERGKANYFHAREQFKMKDLLFSPMMMMMVLPLFLVMLVPKLMNPSDPETKKEMEAQMTALNARGNNLPDMSEMFTNFFSGSTKKAIKPKSSTNKKR